MIKYRNVTSYCCEDISLIENYDKAISNDIIYDCHHRKETDEGLSVKQLKEQNLYFNRPANELIFLSHDEHARLHQTTNNLFKDIPKSLEHKQKISESLKGRKLSNEHKQNISKGLQGHVGWTKGQIPWNKGLKGKPSPNKGKHRVYDENGKYHLEF